MSLPGGTVSPSRLHALQHLERVASTDAYVGQLGGEGGDDRERRQALDLVAGVTRWQRRLDFILSEFYNGDFEDVERRLQIILRLGLYELLYQETPSHAAVDQYVELAKQTIRPGAGGLVNGILRSVNRQRDDLPEPDTGDRAEDLAIHHSHPTWMARRWMERYGEEDAVALMQWNNLRPVYGVRVDTRRTTVDAVTDALDAEDVTWARSHYLTDFLRLKKLQEVVRGPLLEEGHVAVQDESAGLVVRCLNPQPGETVLDLCAAPGGKALYAAMRMEGEGTVRAYDVHEGRLGLVEEAADRHGLSGATCPRWMTRQRPTACSSTCPAPAWASSRSAPTCAGSVPPTTSTPSPSCKPRSWTPPRRSSVRADGSSTARAPSSRKKTRLSSTPSWSTTPSSNASLSTTPSPKK